MVSIMNEALELEVGHNVLEVGAGSGWHAATVAEIIAPKDSDPAQWGHVYSTEIIRELADLAEINLERSGYGERVTVINSDGSEGYSSGAPYDRVLVSAAAPEIPKPLIEQVRTGGILVIPVGRGSFCQTLIRLRKTNSRLTKEDLGSVIFVPLKGKHGQRL